ncbi:MAG: hypothetical protein JWM99_5095 [Verrucomicrobiales bacterium]|nr:hypothetical protein [Verrucomicrobiales bacterium]
MPRVPTNQMLKPSSQILRCFHYEEEVFGILSYWHKLTWKTREMPDQDLLKELFSHLACVPRGS